MAQSGCTVTIVVPCHNSADTVAAALDSALQQSLGDLEIIAVDDGSEDGTRDVLERYVSEHPGRVHVFFQAKSGPYVARNLAIRHARGEFIAFLDSDDMWRREKLERQVAVMRSEPSIGLCHTGGVTLQSNGRYSEPFPATAGYTGDCFRTLLVGNRIATSSVLVRRDILLSLGGFDEAFPARGDWEMWIRVARRHAFAALDEPLTVYRIHDRNMSWDVERMREFHFRIIEKNRSIYKDDVPDLDRCIRQSKFHAYMIYGAQYLQRQNNAEARREFLRALLIDPSSMEAWRRLARSMIGRRLAAGLKNTFARRSEPSQA